MLELEDSQDELEYEESVEDPFKGCEAIIQEEEDEESQSESPSQSSKLGAKKLSRSIDQRVLSGERRKSVNNSDNNYADMELFPGATRNRNGSKIEEIKE